MRGSIVRLLSKVVRRALRDAEEYGLQRYAEASTKMTNKAIDKVSKCAQTIIGLHLIMSEFREWANMEATSARQASSATSVTSAFIYLVELGGLRRKHNGVMARPPII